MEEPFTLKAHPRENRFLVLKKYVWLAGDDASPIWTANLSFLRASEVRLFVKSLSSAAKSSSFPVPGMRSISRMFRIRQQMRHFSLRNQPS